MNETLQIVLIAMAIGCGAYVTIGIYQIITGIGDIFGSGIVEYYKAKGIKTVSKL